MYPAIPCYSYVLCSAPRSGTTLLCDLLRQTGVAGAPDSFFREKSLNEWCEDWGVEGARRPDGCFSDAYLAAVRVAGQGGTDTFGLRLMGSDLEMALAGLAPHARGRTQGREVFDAVFGPTRYIHLSREDKLAEAVSYLRAEQTGLWHGRPDGSDLERLAPEMPDGYDAGIISERMTMLAGLDTAWQAWFDAQGISPLRLSYEALADDPVKTLGKVLEFIGKDPAHAKRAMPGTRKLADATSAAWIARFRAAHPG